MRSALVESGVVVNVIVGALPGFIECPARVSSGWLYDGEMFTAPPEPESEPVPASPYKLFKSAFIERMTPEEAEIFETHLNAHELAKLRLMYHAVEYFASDDSLVAILHWELVTEFGQDRADELLAPE